MCSHTKLLIALERGVSNFDLFDPIGSFADRMILLSAGWVKDPGGCDPFLYVRTARLGIDPVGSARAEREMFFYCIGRPAAQVREQQLQSQLPSAPGVMLQ